MCEFHDSNGNGLGDFWWTDKSIYFSNIDVSKVVFASVVYAIFLRGYNMFPKNIFNWLAMYRWYVNC